MTNDLPPRWYADEAERHARENPPHLAEFERAIAELKAAVLLRSWIGRFLFRCIDWIVRLDAWWKRRR